MVLIKILELLNLKEVVIFCFVLYSSSIELRGLRSVLDLLDRRVKSKSKIATTHRDERIFQQS